MQECYTFRSKDNDECTFSIYGSELLNPSYVDKDCTKIGTLHIKLNNHDFQSYAKVNVNFLFRGTEIEVTAEDEEMGENTKVSIDFLATL